jgi:hypothetical protein
MGDQHAIHHDRLTWVGLLPQAPAQYPAPRQAEGSKGTRLAAADGFPSREAHHLPRTNDLALGTLGNPQPSGFVGWDPGPLIEEQEAAASRPGVAAMERRFGVERHNARVMGSKIADPLGDAARATEARRSARILSLRFSHGDVKFSGLWTQAEGDADFARRRTPRAGLADPGHPLGHAGQPRVREVAVARR